MEKRRQIALYLEEIDSFRPVRYGNAKDLEKYADLLDVAIVNLKEAQRFEELRDGLLYLKLQKKLPASMLTQYHRWIFENHKIESVEALQEWVIREVEFQTKAQETVQGLTGELRLRTLEEYLIPFLVDLTRVVELTHRVEIVTAKYVRNNTVYGFAVNSRN